MRGLLLIVALAIAACTPSFERAPETCAPAEGGIGGTGAPVCAQRDGTPKSGP